MATLTEKVIETEEQIRDEHNHDQQTASPAAPAESEKVTTAAPTVPTADTTETKVEQPTSADLSADSTDEAEEEDTNNVEKIKTQEDGQKGELVRRVTTEGEDYLLPGPKLYLIVASLMLCVFCVALDNTILAVAIPRITDGFHSLDDIGWYISVYLLTSCSFQLFFGKIYSLFNVKWVYLGGLFIFEVGSLICAVAPTSTTLIVGRAIAGLGSGGIFSGALITIAKTVPLDRRPIFFGMIGGMYGIASVAGPLMGGAFTDNEHLTWRWCFYINLPIGGVAAVGLLLFLKLKERSPYKFETTAGIIKKLDIGGTTMFVGAIVCVLLAMQWGGTKYAWSDGRIIALFVLFGVLLIGFIVLQYILKENALVPLRIITQRTIASASLFGACLGGSFFIFIYYVPIWFQAIKGVSPVTAGVDSLPLILSNVFATIVTGGLVTKTGHYIPWFYVSIVLQAIGAGLMYTFTPETSQAAWVGYQFLYGLGVGCGFQQGAVAAQAVLAVRDVSIGTAVVIFIQIFGGALFVAIAQNLFTNALVQNIGALGIPALNPGAIIAAGATGLRNVPGLTSEQLPLLLAAYNAAIVKTFQLGLILSCLALIGAAGLEWKTVKKGKQATSAV